MKLTTTKTELIRALNNSTRAVASRPTFPILGNLKIETSNGKNCATLTGFDLSIGVESQLTIVGIADTSSICIPAKILGEIITKLPDGDITLISEDDQLNIKTKSGKYKIVGTDATEYPELPNPSGNQSITISSEQFLEGIENTVIAASTDDTKAILTAVNVCCHNKHLTFAATDGHRLSVCTIPDVDGDFDLNIPAKALAHLQKIIGKSTSDITISYDAQQLKFLTDRDTVISRTIDGKYPAYSALLPPTFARTITADRKELIDAIELVQLLSSNNIITFDATDKGISIKVETEKGSGDRLVPCLKTGDDIELAFNSKYLLDGLKTINTKDVKIQLNEPLTPVVLEPVGSELKILYLIMPIQIRK
jgi:DNA polymerase-3 subunit beta